MTHATKIMLNGQPAFHGFGFPPGMILIKPRKPADDWLIWLRDGGLWKSKEPRQ